MKFRLYWLKVAVFDAEWAIKGMMLRSWARQTRDENMLALARIMPKRFLTWCFIQVTAEALSGEYSGQNAGDLGAMDALERFTSKHGV